MSTNKQSIAATDMATLAISYTTRRSMNNDIEDIGAIHEAFCDEHDKDSIATLILLSDLAITTHLYMCHFQECSNHEYIMHTYDKTLLKCLGDLFGKNECDNARNLLKEVFLEHASAYEEEKWLESVSKSFQHWLICKTKGLPFPKDKNPYMFDIVGTLSCFTHVTNHIEGLHEMLSKYEIS